MVEGYKEMSYERNLNSLLLKNKRMYFWIQYRTYALLALISLYQYLKE